MNVFNPRHLYKVIYGMADCDPSYLEGELQLCNFFRGNPPCEALVQRVTEELLRAVPRPYRQEVALRQDERDR